MPLAGQIGASGLAALLLDLNERALSGTLSLESGPGPTKLHFIRGRLIAAEGASTGGEAVLGTLTAPAELTYRFNEGFVQLSSFPLPNRINKPLEALLPLLRGTAAAPSRAATPGSPATSRESPPSPPATPNTPAPSPTSSLESFIPDIFDTFEAEIGDAPTVPQAFVDNLRRLFVRHIGPAGQVILENLAGDLRINLSAVRVDRVPALVAALEAELPGTQRSDFQVAVGGLLRQFNIM